MGIYNTIAGVNYLPNEALVSHNYRLFLGTGQNGTYDAGMVRSELDKIQELGINKLRVFNSYFGYCVDKSGWTTNISGFAYECKQRNIKIHLTLFESVGAGGPYAGSDFRAEPWYDYLGSNTGYAQGRWNPAAPSNTGLAQILDNFAIIDRGYSSPIPLAGITGGYPEIGYGGWLPAPGHLYFGTHLTPDYPTKPGSSSGTAQEQKERILFDSFISYVDDSISAIQDVESYSGEVLFAAEIINEPTISRSAWTQTYLLGQTGSAAQLATEFSFNTGDYTEIAFREKSFRNWFVNYFTGAYSSIPTTVGHVSLSDVQEDIAAIGAYSHPFPTFASFHAYAGMGAYSKTTIEAAATACSAIGKECVMSEFQRNDLNPDEAVKDTVYWLQNNSVGPVGGYLWGLFETNSFSTAVSATNWSPASQPIYNIYPNTGFVRSKGTTSGNIIITERRSDVLDYLRTWFSGNTLSHPPDWQVQSDGNLVFKILSYTGSAPLVTDNTRVVWRYKVSNTGANAYYTSRYFGQNLNEDMSWYPGIGEVLDTSGSIEQVGRNATVIDLSQYISSRDFNSMDQNLLVQAWFGEEAYNPMSYASQEISFVEANAFDVSYLYFPGLNNTQYNLTSYGERRSFPNVSNYAYSINSSIRTLSNVEFCWEEVYLEETNSALGYQMPYGYILQFSPDLGYSNILDHFISKNSLLRTSQILTLDNGLLTNNDDGSVTASLPAGIFKYLTSDKNNQRYFWRALPTNEAGFFVEAGYPASFILRNNTIETDWSIDPIDTTVLNSIFLISGTKNEHISIIEVDGESNNTKFTSSTTWEHYVNLVPGDNVFNIRAKDAYGNWSPYKQINIQYQQSAQKFHHIWNAFDDFGLILGIYRIPGETNESFKRRILDVTTNVASQKYPGVLFGAIRELGAKLINNGLSIKKYRESGAQTEDPTIIIRSSFLSVSHPFFTINREPHLINEATLMVNLTENIVDETQPNISFENGQSVKDNLFQIDFERNSIKFDDSLKNKKIYISYSYERIFYFEDYSTLSKLASALNNLLYPNGSRILECQISDALSGNELSKNLLRTNITLSYADKFFAWSDININEIADTYWKLSFENEKGTMFNTKWYGYILQLKEKTRSEWGKAVADITTWDSGLNDQGPIASIIRQFDTNIGNYTNNIDPSLAYAINYTTYDNNVVQWYGPDKFKSGIGFGSDLLCKSKVLEKTKRPVIDPTITIASDKAEKTITRIALFNE